MIRLDSFWEENKERSSFLRPVYQIEYINIYIFVWFATEDWGILGRIILTKEERSGEGVLLRKRKMRNRLDGLCSPFSTPTEERKMKWRREICCFLVRLYDRAEIVFVVYLCHVWKPTNIRKAKNNSCKLSFYACLWLWLQKWVGGDE